MKNRCYVQIFEAGEGAHAPWQPSLALPLQLNIPTANDDISQLTHMELSI
jgi:hypothetical protein